MWQQHHRQPTPTVHHQRRHDYPVLRHNCLLRSWTSDELQKLYKVAPIVGYRSHDLFRGQSIFKINPM